MIRPTLPLAPITATAAAALVLAGCASGPTVRFSGSEVRLTLDEYRIQPHSASVRPGRIKIVARDVGVLTHNVRVEHVPDGGVGPTIVYATTHTAHPGQTVSVKVTLRPGTYRLLCTLSNHADFGQIGTLIVR